jgi:DNA gyrase/topoisomerase IV subunit A
MQAEVKGKLNVAIVTGDQTTIDKLNKELDDITARLAEITGLKDQQLGTVDLQKDAFIAKTTTINTEVNNTIDESDTPEQRREKIMNVQAAQLDEENKAFLAEASQKQGQQAELERLQAEHNKRVVAINKNAADQIKKTDEAQAQSKWMLAKEVGNVIGAIGGLFDQGTAFAKGAALAQIAIDTASAISSLVKMSQANPTNAVTGGISGAIQYATGIAQIIGNIAKAKQILSSVKTTNSGGASPDISAASAAPTAPLINPTALTQQGPQDVRATNAADTVVRAYIVDKDMQDNQTRSNFLNNISRI